jgi:hypothetical protein
MAMAATYRFIPEQTTLQLYGMRISIASVFCANIKNYL